MWRDGRLQEGRACKGRPGCRTDGEIKCGKTEPGGLLEDGISGQRVGRVRPNPGAGNIQGSVTGHYFHQWAPAVALQFVMIVAGGPLVGIFFAWVSA